MIQALKGTFAKMLRPMARIAIRKGFGCGQFMDLVRWAFVDVAEKEFYIPGRKASISRTCILTGLSRKDVSKAQEYVLEDDQDLMHHLNRARRVISGWSTDTEFTTTEGSPLRLPIEGRSPSFTDLVKKYSGDMPVRAMLDELLRVGAVQQDSPGTLTLKGNGFIPQTGEKEKLSIFAEDAANFIVTADNNIFEEKTPRYHKRVYWEAIHEADLPEFKKIMREKSNKMLLELYDWLEKRGVDPEGFENKEKLRKVGTVVYYFENDLEKNEE